MDEAREAAARFADALGAERVAEEERLRAARRQARLALAIADRPRHAVRLTLLQLCALGVAAVALDLLPQNAVQLHAILPWVFAALVLTWPMRRLVRPLWALVSAWLRWRRVTLDGGGRCGRCRQYLRLACIAALAWVRLRLGRAV